MDQFLGNLRNFGMIIVHLIIALVVGLLLVKISVAICNKIMNKTKLQDITKSFIMSFVKFICNVILIILVLNSIGISTTGIVALLSASGLALGLSLQGWLANFVNGFVLIGTKPFVQGDYIEVNGVEGSVKQINMTNCNILTSDQKTIIIPNSVVSSSNIINFSRLGKRIMYLNFTINYNDDVLVAQQIIKQSIEDAAKDNNNILTNKEIEVVFNNLGKDGVELLVSFSVKASQYLAIKYQVNKDIYLNLKNQGIILSSPQLDVTLVDQTKNTVTKK